MQEGDGVMRNEMSNVYTDKALRNVDIVFHLLMKFFLKNIYCSLVCLQLPLILEYGEKWSQASGKTQGKGRDGPLKDNNGIHSGLALRMKLPFVLSDTMSIENP